MFCASRALFSMKARRGSTSSPIRVTNTSSAANSSSSVIRREAAPVSWISVSRVMPGSADESLGDADLTAMQEHFLASEWADRVPVEVELSLEIVLGGHAVEQPELAREMTPLHRVAAEVVASVADTSAAGRHLVVVSDTRGRVLWRAGSAQTLRRADSIAFAEGADWSEKGIGAKIEVIPADKVNEAWDRVVASDVRYRFVIDAATI